MLLVYFIKAYVYVSQACQHGPNQALSVCSGSRKGHSQLCKFEDKCGCWLAIVLGSDLSIEVTFFGIQTEIMDIENHSAILS